MIIAHLTDPHIAFARPAPAELLGKRALAWANWRLRRHRLHRAEVAARVVADLKAAKPDFIAMTGDLVNFSLEAEFAAGAGWLADLGGPERVGVVPGNHEAMARGFEGRIARHWAPYVAGDDGGAGFAHEGFGRAGFPWLRRRGGVALIGLSSAVATPPFFATGRLGAEQIAALEALLAEAGREGQCRVVLVHHPPTRVTKWRKRLTDGAALAGAIDRAGAELVLHGHTHRAGLSWIETRAGRVPVIGAPCASMRGAPGRDWGAWFRLELARDAAGWRLALAERRMTSGGAMADGPRLALRLPRAALARLPAAP